MKDHSPHPTVDRAPGAPKPRTRARAKIHATWFVVPRSGTGELAGLRGEGGLEGDFGKGSDGTLDYWFE